MTEALNKVLTKVETGFNAAACIPIVGAYTSGLRITAGKIQALIGGGLAIAGYIGQLISKNPKWEKVTKLGCEHFIHGVLNIFRGTCEAALSLVGLNIFLLIPNLVKSGQKFGPFVEYSGAACHGRCPVTA